MKPRLQSQRSRRQHVGGEREPPLLESSLGPDTEGRLSVPELIRKLIKRSNSLLLAGRKLEAKNLDSSYGMTVSFTILSKSLNLFGCLLICRARGLERNWVIWGLPFSTFGQAIWNSPVHWVVVKISNWENVIGLLCTLKLNNENGNQYLVALTVCKILFWMLFLY